jgi:hypothetical protein
LADLPLDWLGLIQSARATLQPVLTAVRYDRAASGSGSEAQYLTCSDGLTYVVKFIGNRHGTRILATEQVIGSIGRYLGAPIPPVAHVEVSSAMIGAQGLRINGQPAVAGVHHGSRLELECTDREGLTYTDEAENKPRFAALSVLFAWVLAGDQQWIYKKQAPHLAFSVDHGMFLPGQNGWTAATLASAGGPQIDPQFAALRLERDLYKDFVERLGGITHLAVTAAIARILPEWGVSEADKVALAQFLLRRAGETVQLFEGRMS